MERPKGVKEEEHSRGCGASVANRFWWSNQGAQVASAPPLLVCRRGKGRIASGTVQSGNPPPSVPGLRFHQRSSVYSPLASSLLVTLFDCHTRSPASLKIIPKGTQGRGESTNPFPFPRRRQKLLVIAIIPKLRARISAFLALPGA